MSSSSAATLALAQMNNSSNNNQNDELSGTFSLKTDISNASSMNTMLSSFGSTAAMPNFKRAISTSYPRQTYYELARAMREEVTVKDRTYHLRTYKQCFLGSEAVAFIQKYLELEARDDAVLVGREMNDKIHCWEHVCGDHELKDQKLFYRFTDSSKSQEGILAGVMKSRRAHAGSITPTSERSAATSGKDSLIDDDSDTDNSEVERPSIGADLNQLLKGVDEALAERQQQQQQQQPTSEDATGNKRHSRKPRSRQGSRSPKRGAGDGDGDRDTSPTRNSRSPKRGAGDGDGGDSRDASPTRNGKSERSPRRKENGSNGSRNSGSRSPKPSQTRVPRKGRGNRPTPTNGSAGTAQAAASELDSSTTSTTGQRSRSKSPPRKSGSSNNANDTIRRSNTFHGRGRGEARKQLHHTGIVEQPGDGAGSKRIRALKKKKDGSRSPVRRAESDVSNADESIVSNNAGNDDEEGTAQQSMKQRSASMKAESTTTGSDFPKPTGSLPPRSNSAPSSRTRRRSPPPTTTTTTTTTSSCKGRCPSPPPSTQQSQQRKKEKPDKDFLQKGHASWGPDSDEFLLAFHDDSDKTTDEQGHHSLNHVEATTTTLIPTTTPKGNRSSLEIPSSRSSLETPKSNGRSSLETTKSSRSSLETPRSSRSSLETPKSSRSSLETPKRRSSLATLSKSRSSPEIRNSNGKKHNNADNNNKNSNYNYNYNYNSNSNSNRLARSRNNDEVPKSRSSVEIKKDMAKPFGRSRTSVEIKSRSSMEKRPSLDSKATATTTTTTTTGTRSRNSVEAKSRSSLEIKTKDNKNSIRNARSGLDRGSSHSLTSTGSASRSPLLASLYSSDMTKRKSSGNNNNNNNNNNNLEDENGSTKHGDNSAIAKGSAHSMGGSKRGEERLSLREVAFAERRSSVEGNESVTSALNGSMLGELSDDDEDSNSHEFA